ncbi:hypothetical protein [Segatella copri]|uniref:hypothetical protein n=1 Tax=Segatella copri TaxID=165179 RepID=UPI0015954361|nr:hypothetical protein [Segatella copri]
MHRFPSYHNPNGAYWFDDESGKFITSSCYMNQLPKWMDAFNSQPIADFLSYLAKK